ncbi:MAG: MFS transporter [Nitrososphaerales archaeon]
MVTENLGRRQAIGSFISREFLRYLISTFNADLILPIYSIFLPLLAYDIGASVLEIGLVGGASNAVYSFMPFLMGRISDRKGTRKFFVVSSFGILSVVSISYALVQSPLTLIVARVFEGIGWSMLWPAIEATVRDASDDAKRSLSVFNFTWSGAAAAGPLLGSWLIFFTSIRDAFLATSIILIATLCLNLYSLFGRSSTKVESAVVVSSVKEANHIVEEEEESGSSRPGQLFYLSSMAVAAVSAGVLYTFFTPFAKSLDISILLIGMITFMFGFARFLGYVFTVKENFRMLLLNPAKRVRIILITLVVMSMSSLAMLLNDPSEIVYFIVYAIAGAGFSIVYGISQAAMIAEVSQTKVGRGAGLFESSIGMGMCFGPVAGGLISGGSLSLPFVVPSLSLMLFLIALPRLIAGSRR